MEFRLLGEVELWAGDQALEVGAPRAQAVLAALAVDAGRPVAIETLIDRVWAESPPVEARNVLYSYLSRIRRLLRQAAARTGETAVRIDRRHAGYVLDVDPELVDLHRFRRLADQFDDRRCDAARAAALAEALELWRGSPLAGVPGSWAAQVRDSWNRRRLDAVVRWAEVELRLGRPGPLVTTLPDLAAEYPLAEPLEALLMRALHLAGRGAEALERYASVRQRLAEELGTDPGPELRAAHAAILCTEVPAPAPDPAPGERTRPASRPAERAEPAERAASRPRRTGPHWTRLRPVLAALVALVLAATVASATVAENTDTDPRGTARSIERAQTLFATAQRLHEEGRPEAARSTTLDAVAVYGELLEHNPHENAQPLAPAVVEALARAGIDFSVAQPALLSWLANPRFTPYPAFAQALLRSGWRLRVPVHLDVVVWNYERAAGTSPRELADVRTDVLAAAVLEAANTRYGTRVTEFEGLLASPRGR
ncbi:AfsR/SARP family transcriptional regulator [Actinophytocola xanthii]|uniref:OmpR/PhoB-type domain-containing protein n=1 Tax=Actinophytocola xanthii TaxID=1912961 RepID=A0A1Q8CXW4_9PSEU|nr:BTAD domain-containing putative transcriptional regulator [Actinophytocola xanthii]OLF19185.1 hypothetical protein BU204_02145 [Actinophytocola xanthii]